MNSLDSWELRVECRSGSLPVSNTVRAAVNALRTISRRVLPSRPHAFQALDVLLRVLAVLPGEGTHASGQGRAIGGVMLFHHILLPTGWRLSLREGGHVRWDTLAWAS